MKNNDYYLSRLVHHTRANNKVYELYRELQAENGLIRYELLEDEQVIKSFKSRELARAQLDKVVINHIKRAL